MESLPSLSNPPQQPVPSSEGWDTQQSKVLQGLEHASSPQKGRKGRGGGKGRWEVEVGRGGGDGRERTGIEEEWGSEDRGSEGRGGKGREGKLIETEMNCDDHNGPGREVTME